MALQVGLNIVTLVMCIITLTMASAAILYRLMPQIKQGLVILRDGLLWTLLLSVIGCVGFIGWGRLLDFPKQRTNKIDDAILLENEPERTRLTADRPPAAPSVVTGRPADVVVQHSAQPMQGWNQRQTLGHQPEVGRRPESRLPESRLPESRLPESGQRVLDVSQYSRN